MRSRALRVILTLLAVAAIGVAGYFYWTTLKRINGALAGAVAFNNTRVIATRAAFDLRTAQQAYVAIAQDEAFWFDKVTSSVEALDAALPALEAATPSPDARAALADAAAALREFRERDRRVRGYVSSGQKLLASDIIFVDGIDITSRLLAALDQAGIAAERAAHAARAKASREQITAVAAGAAVPILGLLLLTPLGTRSTEGPALAEQPKPSASSLGLDLRNSVTPAAPRPAAAQAVPVAKAVSKTDPNDEKTRGPLVQIETLAQVCTDLAKLADSSAIPALLERTASTLDASGLVLWVVDAERTQLVPIAAHGYPASLLSRMGTLRTDAENVTAAAFRTGLLQTVHGEGRSSGAIAAPLVSASGCLGVLSAEMRHQGEKLGARLAAASIVAAQLATIVGPPAAPRENHSSAAV